MPTTKLSFCKVRRLNKDIEELIIEDSIEINSRMMNEFHQFIDEKHEKNCAVLENVENNYSYDFSAQLTASNSNRICATAVLVHRYASARIFSSLIKMPRETPWNVQVFYHREHALNWLNEQLEQASVRQRITRPVSTNEFKETPASGSPAPSLIEQPTRT
ncbi:MAG: hypothetical protein V2J55_04735 [Candidatus Competibacteraceae bacterium]|jgi:hypothetical protein|nr:hypothetical protein [Candidatus Competibacteraceae bacterium]